MKKIIRAIATCVMAALLVTGLSVPAAQAAPAPLTTGTKISFKDSRGMRSWYHVYADGIDWSVPVGVVYYLDGDYYSQDPQYSQIMKPRGTTLTTMARQANQKNLVLVVPKTPSARTRANGWTWWERGARNADWFRELAVHLKRKANFLPTRTYVAGYSGGAEMITINLLTKPQGSWITSGGFIMIGGGGVNEGKTRPSRKTVPHRQNRKLPMHWYVGSRDTSGQTNPPTWSALKEARLGHRTYKKAGYQRTHLNVLNGVGHKGYNIPQLINRHTVTANPNIGVNYTMVPNLQMKSRNWSGSSNVARIRQANTKVYVLERNRSWTKIRAGKSVGWVPGWDLAEAPMVETAYTLSPDLQIKASRWSKARTLRTIGSVNTPVYVVQYHGSWARVRSSLTTGWIPARQIADAPMIETAYMTEPAVEIKASRWTRARTVGTTGAANSEVYVLEYQGTWTRVRSNLTTGWIPTRYVVDSPVLGTAYTLAPSLQLKASPWRKAQTVGSTGTENSAVYVLDTRGSWTKIRTGITTGWVASWDLASSPALGTVYTATQNTVMTEVDNPSSAVVATLPEINTELTRLEVSASWAKVRYGSRTGWVPAADLSDQPVTEVEMASR